MIGERLDSTTTQVIGNYLRFAADEVEIAMVRSSYSTEAKESFDCSAAIVGANGEYWAQADSIPIQAGVLATVVVEVLNDFAGDLKPGDVIFTNDPGIGAPHLNDFVSIAPIFLEGRLVSAVATLLHHADIGGKTPGSQPPDATELFHEGIRIPPTRMFSNGTIDERALRLLSANTRKPTTLGGDLRAQVAASLLGVERVTAAADRYGHALFLAHVGAFLDYSERLVRAALSPLRHGSYTATRLVDTVDPSAGEEVLRVVADVTIDAERISIDFSRSSDQVSRPINVVMSNTIASTMVAVRSMAGIDVPVNGGLQRMTSISARPGSLLNPIMPAPVAARAMVAALAYDAVLACLCQASPDFAIASSSGGTTMIYKWATPPKPGQERHLLQDNSLTGGMGGRREADGINATDNSITNALNLPVEMLEQESPVIVERYELRKDSGGPGEHRGGVGLRRIVRFLEAGAINVRTQRFQFPALGIEGGKPGATGRFMLRRNGVVTVLPSQISNYPTEAGDAMIAETPGGGGFGEPSLRDRRTIERDVALGYITPEHAKEAYGVDLETSP